MRWFRDAQTVSAHRFRTLVGLGVVVAVVLATVVWGSGGIPSWLTLGETSSAANVLPSVGGPQSAGEPKQPGSLAATRKRAKHTKRHHDKKHRRDDQSRGHRHATRHTRHGSPQGTNERTAQANRQGPSGPKK